MDTGMDTSKDMDVSGNMSLLKQQDVSALPSPKW